MPSVTVGSESGNDVELYYGDDGSGRSVVLIHGWPLSNRAWEPQRLEISGQRTAEAVSDAKLVVIEGAPHGLNATHADRFNSELIDFLGG